MFACRELSYTVNVVKTTIVEGFPLLVNNAVIFSVWYSNLSLDFVAFAKLRNVHFPLTGRRMGSGTFQGSNQSLPTSGLGSSGSPQRGISPQVKQQAPPQRPSQPRPQAPPRSHSPSQRGVSPTSRAESSLRKTGSSVDYTSTQWDSDDDEFESDEDEEPTFTRGPARPGFPQPQTRQPPVQQQQPSPAPRQQVKTITSKPLKQDDDDDDWNDSDR